MKVNDIVLYRIDLVHGGHVNEEYRVILIQGNYLILQHCIDANYIQRMLSNRVTLKGIV